MSLYEFLRAARRWLTEHPFSWRRLGFLVLAVGGFVSLLTVVRAGQMLDDVLFRGYRQQPLQAPLFIIATPRSGSTFLQRLLCLDEARFVTFKTYQTLLPAITLYKGVQALGAGSSHLSRRLFRGLQKQMGDVWEGIHRLRLDQEEEDEALFLLARHTPAIYMLLPHVDALPRLRCFDAMPARQRRALMRQYRQALQRFLYAYGRGRSLLVKNVLSCTRVRSLLQAFPEARFVFLVRHPYQGIPSFLSLFYSVWEMHSPGIPPDSAEIRQLAEAGYENYLHLTAALPSFPEERMLCLKYEALVADPFSAVTAIYDRFGIEMSPAFYERLVEATAASREYNSQHNYSLAQYGLDEETVYEALAPVFAAHGYAR